MNGVISPKYDDKDAGALLRLIDEAGPDSAVAARAFRRLIYRSYQREGRVMPWRSRPTPYRVFVSELMLQQTQVERVAPKFREFVKQLPSFAAVAAAPLPEVLGLWSGLGYNRRALALKQAATIITDEYRGRLPRTAEELTALPGVGHYTAGALLAFAYNQPTVFIETNIRTVFLYFFCRKQDCVQDKELLAVIEAHLDRKNPRDWYHALMDYGAKLKAAGVRLNHRSAHYRKQSPFVGSRRQLRGQILRVVVAERKLTLARLARTLQLEPSIVEPVVARLSAEGLLRRSASTVMVCE